MQKPYHINHIQQGSYPAFHLSNVIVVGDWQIDHSKYYKNGLDCLISADVGVYGEIENLRYEKSSLFGTPVRNSLSEGKNNERLGA